MRRAAWIFLASILLPSLGLAWMAIHSAQDQQVVLEHQQVIISQNITDALAKDIQSRMDQIRAEFTKTTQQLLDNSPSTQDLADNFDHKLTATWPLAEIGFAVNIDGEIYSPQNYDSPAARTFRNENDRFLSNRENVEVYSSNAQVQTAQAGKEAATGKIVNSTSPAEFSLAVRDKITHDADALTRAKDEAEHAALQAVKKQTTLEEDKRTDQMILDANRAPATPAPDTHERVASRLVSKSTAAGEYEAQGNAMSVATPASASTATAGPVAAAAPAPKPSLLPEPAADVPGNLPSGEAGLTKTAPLDDVSQSDIGATGGSSIKKADDNLRATDGSFRNQSQSQKVLRNVMPQQGLARQSAEASSSVPEASDFRRVIGTEASGELARFLENKLRLMVWSHAPADSPFVFGAQLNSERVIESLRDSFKISELAPDSYSSSGGSEMCVAILDDTGRPVARSIANFQGDWKHPFVATEIGDSLPHWEAALYLVDPKQFSRAAQTLRVTIALIVLVLMAAIVAGGSIIAADVRRQVRLAQQKTDFVSNVSHELKTPLTSIRMFADLLAEKRVPDEERQATYLRIIAAEAARLTRLINNVLDFARLERGKSMGEPRPCDLVEATRDVVGTCAPHLEASGITFRHEVEAESLPIRGDLDALAQIILNLISNAEKYGGNDILVRVRRQDTATGALGCVDVLDRGAGIPAQDVKTVFEPFQRLDDSLASGIPGSGLGLTLARRMARAHGGDITYTPRAGGGSCFTLTVPLAAA